MLPSARLPIVKKLLSENGAIAIPSRGYSMYPAIRPKDECVFAAANEEEIAIGDILLFENEDGMLVGHRLIGIAESAAGRSYVCKGDANRYPDVPVGIESIAGKLSAIRRGRGGSRRRRISHDGRAMALWGKTVMKYPIVSALLRKWVGRSR